MLEDIVKAQVDRDRAMLEEELSPQKIQARRLAAGILTVHAVVAVTIAETSRGELPYAQVILSLALAYLLFKLHPRAVPLTLAFAVLAAVAFPLRDFLEMRQEMAWRGGLDVPREIALSESLRICGVVGALLLLLADEADRRRQSLAVILFVITSLSHPLAAINRSEPPELLIADLQYFRSITTGIRRAETLKLYEGLPHQLFARQLFESELATKKTVELLGHHFYESPLNVSTEDTEGLRRVSVAPESYRTYPGPTPCGGFHPDYALIWEARGQTYGVLLCYGCSEALLYGPEQELMAELAGPFWGILRKYNSQAP